MSQLMSESEHLGRLGVRTIDEDKRGKIVGHSKAAKFIRIETPPVIVQHHAAAHDEDS